jgi:tryptophan 2,3-dioxygenase
MIDNVQRSAGINPYHCYIRLDDLTPLHERTTTWPGEAHFRCGFAAVELHLGLMHAVADDHRPYVARHDRDTHLTDSLIEQLGLLARGSAVLPPPPDDLLTATAPSAFSLLREAPPKLAPDGTWLAHAMAGRLAALPSWAGLGLGVVSLPTDLGFGVVSLTADPAQPSLPYDDWIDPRGLWSRASADPYGAEDLIFRGVHQAIESWFRLIESTLGYGESLIAQGNWAAAADTTTYVADVLHFIGTHVRVLDHMNLDEYDPLRVALKSASGAQSAAAATATIAITRQYDRYAAVRDASLPISRILRNPAEHADEYRYVNALGRLESALSDFLHSHYYRAIRVQSRRGLGSLGGGIDGLLARAVRPVFPELDEARFEHLLHMNWQYSDIQGTLIGPLTRAIHEPDPPAPVSASRATSSLAALDSAFLAGDPAACAALFEPGTGCVQDVPGTRYYRGGVEVTDYFNAVFQSLTVTAVRAGDPVFLPDRAGSDAGSDVGSGVALDGDPDVAGVTRDADFDVTAVTGPTATLPVRWELEFGATGRISLLRVGWDTTAIATLMLSG